MCLNPVLQNIFIYSTLEVGYCSITLNDKLMLIFKQ